MIKPKDKLWYVDNKLGKVSCVTVEKVRKNDFSFRSRRDLYRADFSTIGTKYFTSQEELFSYLKHRTDYRNKETNA